VFSELSYVWVTCGPMRGALVLDMSRSNVSSLHAARLQCCATILAATPDRQCESLHKGLVSFWQFPLCRLEAVSVLQRALACVCWCP
jgi:hypothetical protein